MRKIRKQHAKNCHPSHHHVLWRDKNAMNNDWFKREDWGYNEIAPGTIDRLTMPFSMNDTAIVVIISDKSLASAMADRYPVL